MTNKDADSAERKAGRAEEMKMFLVNFRDIFLLVGGAVLRFTLMIVGVFGGLAAILYGLAKLCIFLTDYLFGGVLWPGLVITILLAFIIFVAIISLQMAINDMRCGEPEKQGTTS